jgi:ketosteroid isomerase-like protein
MPADPESVARALSDAMAAQDVDRVRALLAPEFHQDDSRRLIEPAVHEGSANAIESWLRYVENWESVEPVSQEFIARGDQVVIAVRLRARGLQSQVDVEADIAFLIRVEDGLVTESTYFGSREEALAAAG